MTCIHCMSMVYLTFLASPEIYTTLSYCIAKLMNQHVSIAIKQCNLVTSLPSACAWAVKEQHNDEVITLYIPAFSL